MKRERIPEIYLINSKMKISFNTGRFKFYLWVGFGWFLLWLFIYLMSSPELFQKYFFNEIWRDIYIVVVNYLFFEYTLPFIRRKRKNIFIKILLFLLVLWAQFILYSFGLYAWRYIGIQLHIYTALRTFTSVGRGVAYHFQFAIFSIFFFGV